MKKIVLAILFASLIAVVSFNVGASTTVPASGVTYTNGSTSTTVKDSLDDLISKTKVGTATSAQILSGKTALVQGSTVTGTMTDRGAVSKTDLAAGSSYTIPAGYHNGSGKVTAKSLADQTSATATATQILSGQTAYVNGTKLTGTMTNRGAVSKTDLAAGSSYTIPAGYHNGSGKVTAKSLADQTSATATASDILSGKTAYVNGSKITGTNDGGYKVATFNGAATVSSDSTLSGSWVNFGWETASSCSSGDCDWDSGGILFSIDLGVTPTTVTSIRATLSSTSYSKETAFRMHYGYKSGTTTQEYRYMNSLIATEKEQDFFYGTSDTSNQTYIYSYVNGSVLYFAINPYRWSYTNGTTKTIFETCGTAFKLEGTVTYK